MEDPVGCDSDALAIACLISGVEDQDAETFEMVGIAVSHHDGVEVHVLADERLVPVAASDVPRSKLDFSSVHEDALAVWSRDEARVALTDVDEREFEERLRLGLENPSDPTLSRVPSLIFVDVPLRSSTSTPLAAVQDDDQLFGGAASLR